MRWANTGPGAKRGIGRIFFGDKKAKVTDSDCLNFMCKLLEKSGKKTGKHVPKLELRDIEHSLCETDKYLRALHGDGRPKALYRGQQ